MASPTRYPSGVTNVTAGNPLGQYGAPDPTKWHTYFNDFDAYTAANFTITNTGTPTAALANADGGILVVTNSAANNDASFYNKIGESFLLEAGKRAIFKARLKVDNATNAAFVAGLQVTDTTPLDVTDGIYFLKAAGAATVSVFCRKDGTTGSNSAAAVATLSNDTYYSFAWYYDGKGNLTYTILDATETTVVAQGSLDASSSYLPDTTLTVSFGVQNGTAAARTLSIDSIFAAKERF